jgi:hypothetical protein
VVPGVHLVNNRLVVSSVPVTEINGLGPISSLEPALLLRRAPLALQRAAAASVPVPFLVRADTVYLRQDFSLELPVSILPGTNLATDARFDFVVRTRKLSAASLKQEQKFQQKESQGQQREALLWTLRKLTGNASGTAFTDWVFSQADPRLALDARQAAKQLHSSRPERQEAALAKLRDGNGTTYTEELAASIPKLAGTTQAKARQALAERLARMKADTLRNKLQEANAEIRRAAAAACSRKEMKSLIPDLIPLLEDSEQAVARAAHSSLRTLTGQDLGPKKQEDALPEAWAEAAAAWRAWWQETGSDEY